MALSFCLERTRVRLLRIVAIIVWPSHGRSHRAGTAHDHGVISTSIRRLISATGVFRLATSTIPLQNGCWLTWFMAILSAMEYFFACPYCGERISMVLDTS